MHQQILQQVPDVNKLTATFTNTASEVAGRTLVAKLRLKFVTSRRSFERQQLLLFSGFLSTLLSFTGLVLVAGCGLGSLLTERRLGVPRLQTVPSCWRLFLDRHRSD